MQYENNSVADIPVEKKQALLEGYLDLVKYPEIVHHTSYYVDRKTKKSIYSSKGTAVIFDTQTCGIRLNLELVYKENKDTGVASMAAVYFDELKDLKITLRKR